MALVVLPYYDQLSEPVEVAKTKAEFCADSDKIFSFWDEPGGPI